MESSSKAHEKLFKSAQCFTGGLQATQCERGLKDKSAANIIHAMSNQ